MSNIIIDLGANAVKDGMKLLSKMETKESDNLVVNIFKAGSAFLIIFFIYKIIDFFFIMLEKSL